VLIFHNHNSNIFQQVLLHENCTEQEMMDAGEAMAKRITPQSTAVTKKRKKIVHFKMVQCTALEDL
jgi:hypothetical protein